MTTHPAVARGNTTWWHWSIRIRLLVVVAAATTTTTTFAAASASVGRSAASAASPASGGTSTTPFVHWSPVLWVLKFALAHGSAHRVVRVLPCGSLL